jgi:hypothetical protein
MSSRANPMTDDELDAILGRIAELQGRDISMVALAPADFARRFVESQTPAVGLGGRQARAYRFGLLVAALVLLALAIAGFILVGSALLRPGPEDRLLGADEVVCLDLVPADLVGEIYNPNRRGPSGLLIRTAETEEFHGEDDYVRCDYRHVSVEDVNVEGAGDHFLSIAVRTRSTEGSLADDIAHTWLGLDAVPRAVDGHPAWQNRCMASPRSSSASCNKAVAVFAEPWFIVITMVRGSHPIPTEIVPALIPVLVERLEQTGPARTP